ncbi:uncharacterized protein PHALS_04858 [Plasmopara halstedii]|uniref:Uncharacterized protein n=1 Tax=Plasmopara halstedii TaxID=4781 RepID=A0A0P1AZ41_PLAHL|nr:uncharacterized protein PHALS_04858 [Plasmopara halstedii]CEG47714.1 hypothetical protein PHALS_04858 [Plasmopara halstedii]|eukprot:XP_024584083.1 hypothetical protein PHALS_04858 [Plasmopara halstedii]
MSLTPSSTTSKQTTQMARDEADQKARSVLFNKMTYHAFIEMQLMGKKAQLFSTST